ncbi:MAG: glycosyltransferase family 2 protein [Rubripirellula sp.]|nr:glycosyltransferase family 2 protein [Rubripirellula sp.]
MKIDNNCATDDLFAAEAESQEWFPVEFRVMDQIDQTLDLLAEANSLTAGDHEIDQIDVTVIVPVFNEINTLPGVLERLDEVMPPATEVIVVDDGSTDGTSEWLAELPTRANRQVIQRRCNHGKGSAVRLGVRHSQGKVIAIQDADLEYDPADLLRVIWPVLEGTADAVYGSRYLHGHQDPSWLHRIGNQLLTFSSNTMTGLRLTDMETCHKAFDGDMLRSIPLEQRRFGFEPEITAKIAARRARVMEVATQYQGRGFSEGKKIGWRDGFAALACIWRYRR